MIILKIPVPFSQLSSSLSDSLKRLPSSSKWLSAALPRSWYCTNLWMDHHQWANPEYNLYHACDPWHMNQDWKIEHWEAEYVYTHSRVAHRLLRTSLCHQLVQVAFRAKVAPVMVEVYRAFAPPAWLWIFCGASWAKKVAICLIFANDWQVSFDCSLHHVMPGKVNTRVLLFSDFGPKFLD
jgi:hypothetical protein